MHPSPQYAAQASHDIDSKAYAMLAQAGRAFAHKPFTPHRIFKGGHAQTLAAYAWPRTYRLFKPNDEQRLFEVETGVKVLAECRWQNDRTQHATIVLWHGMEGSTTSGYMIATADKGFRAGFNVVRVNLRNCGNTENLAPTLYHGGLSGDLRAVMTELIEQDKLTRIVPIGYSLGGNLVLKLAAEYGNCVPPQILGIVAVSPSVNLGASSEMICQRSNWIYHRDFVRRLRRKIRVTQKLYPELYDFNKMSQVRTIRDFDEHFTAVAHGFVSADDYYYKSSSIHLIDKISVPTLIIHAQDDPFIPYAPLRNAALATNPHILLLAPERGGHVAFIASEMNHDEDRFWAENRAVEFCRIAINPENT